MKKLLLSIAVMATTFTQAQVSLVQDFNPGTGNGFGDEIISINNKVVFTAKSATSNLMEVWESAGTTSNTTQITFLDVLTLPDPRNFYYWPYYDTVAFSHNISSTATPNYVVSTYDGDGNLTYQYATGTPAIDSSTHINNFFAFRETSGTEEYLGFAANTTVGEEYYKARDLGQTQLVKDMNPGSPSSSPTNFQRIGDASTSNYFFFSAENATSGRELWYSIDGFSSLTFVWKDINPGSNSSDPKDLTEFNSKIYFTADDGINGRELWVNDGTIAGTIRVAVINPVAGDLSDPENFTVFNNALYFTATHPTLGTEIFKLTTNSGITNLKNIANGSGSSTPSDLFVFNNRLYFSADDTINGRELWSTTGFSSTTNMLKDINTSPATPDSNPSGFTPYLGELFFSANNDTNGRELWKTDGTNAGTVLVSDINLSGDSNPENLTVAGDNLFFSATTPATGKELFKYIDPSLSVNSFDSEQNLSLFPNPTTDSFSVNTPLKILTVELTDLQGKLVKTFINQQDNYSIKDLNVGLYFINIITKNGTITKKLIKK